jgi:diguanylate cyclase (GGDEF)-like protein
MHRLPPVLLAEITQALNAAGGRLLILAKPLAQRAQIYSYGLQPRTSTPIEKNPFWQNLLSTETTTDRSVNFAGIPGFDNAAEVDTQASGWQQARVAISEPNSSTGAALPIVYPIDCISAQPELAPLFSAFSAVDIRSLSIVPLRYDRHCVGCLTIFRSAPTPTKDLSWSDCQLQLAQDLAMQMYLAIMQQRVERMFRDRVYYDLLTGLPNRMLFSQYLTLALAKMPSSGELVAVILLNLDRFKNINDSLGHRCGDRLLQLVAERLENTLGTEATICRWSGDEFALMMPALSDLTALDRVADRVLSCFELPFEFEPSFQSLRTDSLYIKASVGIAIAPTGGSDLVERLLQHADAALERAQSSGQNNYEIYTDLVNDPTTLGVVASPRENRLQLENMLDRAIANADGKPFDDRKLLLHYQPQIDTQTGKIIGIEALMRCQDIHANLINPADFIPIAEETGSIVPMGEWVIRTACKQNKLWQDLGLGNFSIAINFSVKQLQDRNLIDTIKAVLAKTGLSPTSLEIEITESIAIKDLDLTIAILESLREIGVKISLDDFGTGYSSLAALKYLPLDRLKIDRSFIRELRTHTVDAGIVRTIVNLGHELNLTVIAEGVETVEQFEFLRSIDCDAVQGFLFSRPLPAADLEIAIANGHWQQDFFDNRH